MARNPQMFLVFLLHSHFHPAFWPPASVGLKEYDPDQRLLALLGAFDFSATGGSKEAGHFCRRRKDGARLVIRCAGEDQHVESVE